MDAFERPTLARHIDAIGGGASRGTGSGWPTITVGDADSGQEGRPAEHLNQLAKEVTARLWPTARSSDYKSGQVSDEVWDKNSRPLTEQAVRFSESLSGRLSPTTPPDGDLSWLATLASLPLSLNPSFVEWLQWGKHGIGLTCLGHPAIAIDPTVSEDSATPSARRRRKRPSVSSGSGRLVSGRHE